ncbi:MAG: DUF4153 domain-containing protein [Patescibacteria group bacterium]|nr:DUF4153 domain-containing protein [Patescibacteria group bacterium]
MLKIIRFNNFKRLLKDVFARLPLSMLFSLSAFTLLLIRIGLDEKISYNTENLIDKGILTLSIFFFFSIGVYLLGESLALPQIKKCFSQIATIILACLYYFSFEENLFQDPYTEIIVYIIMTIVAIIAFVFFAPFILSLIRKNISQRRLYVFSYNLLIKTLMAMIAGLATMILGFIALSSVFTLFDLNEIFDQGNMFARWTSFALALFAPIFFLINLPSIEVNKEEKIQNNKFYSFLINYIGLPAITIYFLILYSYTIKVLINFSNWPQGEVAWMVILFSFFGYLVYFVSYIFTEKLKIAEIFRKIFPFAVLLQTFMLFYAIFLRINQYDLTINRYLVVAFGLWLFSLSVYFIVSKKKYLGTIFYSLVSMIIIISIGPWSVYILPEKRQQAKLKIYLEEAKMLNENKIVPLEKYNDIPAKLSGQIYGAIEYLCAFHGCDTLNDFFAEEIAEIKRQNKINFIKQKEQELANIEIREDIDDERRKEMIERIEKRKYREIRHWSIINDLTTQIKVQRYFNKENTQYVPRVFTYNLVHDKRVGDSVRVSGYDYYMNLKSDFNLVFFDDRTKMDYKKTYQAALDSKNEQLIIYYGEMDKIAENEENYIMEIFSLNEEFTQILEKFKSEEANGRNFDNYIEIENPADLTFNLSGEKFDAHLQLYEVSIKNPEWQETDENKIATGRNTSGQVLLKIK